MLMDEVWVGHSTHGPRPIRAMRTWRYGLPLGGLFRGSNVKRRELTDVHLKFDSKSP